MHDRHLPTYPTATRTAPRIQVPTWCCVLSVVLSWALAGAFPATAAAQPSPSTSTVRMYGPTTMLDKYGNARPFSPNRRTAGVFATDAQRNAFRGYQTLGRRVDRRGGLSLLLPSGGHRRFLQALPGQRGSINDLMPGVPWSRRNAFARYGGFGTRPQSADPKDVAGIFSRRYELLAATALTASVTRAAITPGVGLPMRARAAPPVDDARLEPTVPSDAPTLAERLHDSTAESLGRVREEAWDWFGQGVYRRAARAFETAALSDEFGSEARIGEILCHVATGSTQSAAAVLRQLIRRDNNPFLHPLDLPARFGDSTAAQRVRVDALRRAPLGPAFLTINTLRAFVLWHMRERGEASRLVGTLDLAGTVFGRWPAQMQAAQDALLPDSVEPRH